MECMCALRYLSVLKGEMCGLGGLYNLVDDRGSRSYEGKGRGKGAFIRCALFGVADSILVLERKC